MQFYVSSANSYFCCNNYWLDQPSQCLFCNVPFHVFRSCGTVPLDDVAKRQLRQDLQLGTEADYSIVLTRAEKLHPGIYTFLQGDPRQNVARVQALFETL